MRTVIWMIMIPIQLRIISAKSKLDDNFECHWISRYVYLELVTESPIIAHINIFDRYRHLAIIYTHFSELSDNFVNSKSLNDLD